MEILEELPYYGSFPGTYAYGVSADGFTIVGFSKTGGAFNSTIEACRWDYGVISGLGFLPGGSNSNATDVSSDGTVIVGASRNADNNSEAFRWENGIMVGLGDLPGDGFSSRAYGVSSDGNVVVGGGEAAPFVIKPFVWTQIDGMRNLEDILISHGVDLTGWNLREATGVSGDGTVIIGRGTNPNGDLEGWLVDLK